MVILIILYGHDGNHRDDGWYIESDSGILEQTIDNYIIIIIIIIVPIQ